MQSLKEALFYEIYRFQELDFVIAPINFVLIGLCILIMFIAKRIAWRSLDALGNKTSRVRQKHETLYRLSKQIIYILTILLCVESFNINNDQVHFGTILNIPITGNYNGFQLYVYHILLAVAMVVFTRLILNLLKLYLHKAVEKREWIDEGKEFTIFQLLKYIIYVVMIIALVRSTGVKMDLLIVSSGALFVGVGLGLQFIFADYMSGIIILFDGTVKVGDVILLNNQVARVELINIRTTKVTTREGETLIVPNSKLTSDTITNWTHTKKFTRFGIDVSTSYSSDTRQVESVLLEAAKKSRAISKTKKSVVFFRDFGDSGLLFTLYVWVDNSFDAEKTLSDIRHDIFALFAENNIEIPFPQRVVHMPKAQA